ncbi:MAG: hypothetical protein ACK5L6_01450 [Anaerorhabdus sp.]|uniref:hypothetical protein n=1 Tax=Anaerorhabdus sp. TaxID=1872524 RepID=UPI003A880378
MEVSNEIMKVVLASQIDETEGAIIYGFMASRQKDEKNKALLQKMADDESKHALVWKPITKKDWLFQLGGG